jgi:hypothetical protein
MLPRGRLAAGQDSPRDGGSPQAEIALSQIGLRLHELLRLDHPG